MATALQRRCSARDRHAGLLSTTTGANRRCSREGGCRGGAARRSSQAPDRTHSGVQRGWGGVGGAHERRRERRSPSACEVDRVDKAHEPGKKREKNEESKRSERSLFFPLLRLSSRLFPPLPPLFLFSPLRTTPRRSYNYKLGKRAAKEKLTSSCASSRASTPRLRRRRPRPSLPRPGPRQRLPCRPWARSRAPRGPARPRPRRA